MPYTAKVYRVLIASPSDLSKERELLPDVLHDWNRLNAATTGISFQPAKWELDVYPQMGKTAQDLLNKSLVDECDILIGMFWTRVGQPTKNAESGTAEEIKRFLAAKKLAMLYFSQVPVPHNLLDVKQWARLHKLRTVT